MKNKEKNKQAIKRAIIRGIANNMRKAKILGGCLKKAFCLTFCVVFLSCFIFPGNSNGVAHVHADSPEEPEVPEVLKDENSQSQKSIISKNTGTGKVSINVKNADLRDVLSAVALGMGMNIILVEQPTRVSFQIKDATYKAAFEYLLKTVGMEYLSSGNFLIVGKRETLQRDFFNQMLLTRFDLNYITADTLSRQIDTLGIPIKKITVEENTKSIWVQGTPQSLSKVKELISMIDIRENAVKEGEAAENIKLVQFELKYINAQTFDSLIKQLGINANTIIIDTNPQKIWVSAKAQELLDIEELRKSVDVEENVIKIEEASPLELIPYPLEFVSADNIKTLITQMGIDVTVISFASNPYKIWVDSRSKGISDFEELVAKVDIMENSKRLFNITVVELKYLAAEKFKSIVQQLDIPVQVITLDSNTYTVWLVGESKDILDIKILLKNIDTDTVREDSAFFIHKLTNISPDDAVTRFQYIGITDAQVFVLNYPKFSRELLVVCRQDRKEEITQALVSLDVKGEKIKVPVDYSRDAAGQARLAARRDILVKLTGIPASSFFISNNISRDSTPHFIMWVEETPENVKKIKDMINSIDSP